MKNLIALLTLLILPFSLKTEEDKNVYKYLQLFGEAFEQIKNNYVEDVTSKDLIESAIEGMLSSLDPHSTYLNYDELNELKVQTKGEFGGLGIEVTLENGFVKVIAPIDDTPADKAGIKSGDLITHLDDEPVLGMTLSEAVTIMRGKVGSKIKLTINRNENENLQIFITRAIIQLKAVKARVENNIGYIRVSSFNQKVDRQIINSIKDFKKEKLIGYVLDLRNNPGGLLDQAVNVTDIFLEKEIDLAIFPGIEGDFGVLKSHMPFLTLLRVGIVYIYLDKKLTETFLVTGGIIEVSKNKCTLLTEEIIDTSSVDLNYKTNESSNKDETNLKKLKEKALEKLHYS